MSSVPRTVSAAGDGRHRWRAAKELGIEKIPVRVINPPDSVEYILSAAIERRHLTGERAALVLEREEYVAKLRKEAEERKAQAPELPRGVKKSSLSILGYPQKGKTFELVGAKAKVSAPTLFRVSAVKKKSPELYKKVKAGEISAKRAYGIVKQKEAEAKAQARRTVAGRGLTRIVLGDASELLDRIKDGSFDCLFTDPLYSTDVTDFDQYLDSWPPKALAKVRDTGRIFIFAGPYPDERGGRSACG